MKVHRSFISFLFPVLGLFLLSFWIFTTKEPLTIIGYCILGLSLFLIAFGLYFKFQSYKNVKSGLTSDDELSKRIKRKAAANSFNISIYMWLFIILFLIGEAPKIKIILGLGLLGMVVVFFLYWLYYSKTGISDENKN